MERDLNDWFTYNHEANVETIAALREAPHPTDKALSIMGHVLNAHRVWLHRIHPLEKEAPQPWQANDPATFAATNDRLLRDTRLYLQSGAFGLSLHKPITYTNTKGERFENTILEIFFQILAHSAYHRGQLALMLRQDGVAPPLTDYIFLRRNPQPVLS
ncbi:DinB family protein [Catalinimonas alkaloidigena]|nr:DinB family protein [Catalinimonas alkaloidigena]